MGPTNRGHPEAKVVCKMWRLKRGLLDDSVLLLLGFWKDQLGLWRGESGV